MWDGRRYHWVPPHWELRAGGRAWRPAHWEMRGGGQIWVPGAWVAAGPPAPGTSSQPARAAAPPPPPPQSAVAEAPPPPPQQPPVELRPSGTVSSNKGGTGNIAPTWSDPWARGQGGQAGAASESRPAESAADAVPVPTVRARSDAASLTPDPAASTFSMEAYRGRPEVQRAVKLAHAGKIDEARKMASPFEPPDSDASDVESELAALPAPIDSPSRFDEGFLALWRPIMAGEQELTSELAKQAADLLMSNPCDGYSDLNAFDRRDCKSTSKILQAQIREGFRRRLVMDTRPVTADYEIFSEEVADRRPWSIEHGRLADAIPRPLPHGARGLRCAV